MIVLALVSGASGAFAAAAAEWLGDVMGVNTTVVRVVGAALVLFAIDVALSARSERDRRIVFARAIGVADAADRE